MRVLVLGVVPLVLGFLTTWAVAWGLTLTPIAKLRPANYDPIDSEQRVDLVLIRMHSTWRDADSYLLAAPDSASIPFGYLRSLEQVPRSSYVRRAWRRGEPAPTGAWTHTGDAKGYIRELLHNGAVSTEIRIFQWDEFTTGWPARSAMMYQAPFKKELFDAIERPPWTDNLVGKSRGAFLPARPIWPGLIANTLIYAAIWALLFLAPGFAQRRLRAWRGRCPRSMLRVRPQASPGCPECGWRRGE